MRNSFHEDAHTDGLKTIAVYLQAGNLSAIEKFMAGKTELLQNQVRAHFDKLRNPLTRQRAQEDILRLFQYAQTNTTRRVLYVASNPAGTTPLKLREEYAQLSIQLTDAVGSYTISPLFACNAVELLSSIHDLQPHIIHFAGHGTSEGLLLQNEDKNGYEFISGEALGALFAYIKNKVSIEAVLLNACFTQTQASYISAHIPVVVGTTISIKDIHSIAFTTGFYMALARGLSFLDAFDAGKVLAIIKGSPEEAFRFFQTD